jgi:hypothetical protein
MGLKSIDHFMQQLYVANCCCWCQKFCRLLGRLKTNYQLSELVSCCHTLELWLGNIPFCSNPAAAV